MTLRATIEIVPCGDESNKRSLHRLDISNMGRVRPPTFIGEICKYRVDVYSMTVSTPEHKGGEWQHIDVYFIEEFNRRGGPVALVAKAASLVEAAC